MILFPSLRSSASSALNLGAGGVRLALPWKKSTQAEKKLKVGTAETRRMEGCCQSPPATTSPPDYVAAVAQGGLSVSLDISEPQLQAERLRYTFADGPISRALLVCRLLLFAAVTMFSAEPATAETAPQEVLSGLRQFFAKTSSDDGSFSAGVDPDYRGISDSAYSDLAPVTYAITIHKTFAMGTAAEKLAALLLSRQNANGDFFSVRGTVNPKSAEGRVYNTTQGIVALHALGLKPRHDPLPVFTEILQEAYKALPAYSTSFFPLAYLASGVSIPPEADRRIRATMVQAPDGYLHDHIAATFHAVHYYRLINEPVPMAAEIVERTLRDQKPDGSWLLNMPSRDRHATFDAVFTLRQLAHAWCRAARQIKPCAWALSCRNADGGSAHFPDRLPMRTRTIIFQAGVLVMGGFLKPVTPLPQRRANYCPGDI